MLHVCSLLTFLNNFLLPTINLYTYCGSLKPIWIGMMHSFLLLEVPNTMCLVLSLFMRLLHAGDTCEYWISIGPINIDVIFVLFLWPQTNVSRYVGKCKHSINVKQHSVSKDFFKLFQLYSSIFLAVWCLWILTTSLSFFHALMADRMINMDFCRLIGNSGAIYAQNIHHLFCIP